jgi:hypothetical protein
VVVVAEPLPDGAASARVLVEGGSRLDAPAITVVEATRALTAPLRARDGIIAELVVHKVDERPATTCEPTWTCRVPARSRPAFASLLAAIRCSRGAPDRVEVEVVRI